MLKDIFIGRDADTRFFVFLSIGLSLLVVSSYVMGARVERGDASVPSETASRELEVTLEARAAYVYDMRTQEVIFAKNENVRRPLASLTKVMTALVASELAPAYGTVIVSEEALEPMGESGLVAGERWNLKDLLDFSLITSSNDGMRAVALSLGSLERSNLSNEEILNDFVGAMNHKATTLGLKNTYYWNETGLDETEYKGGAYGTAKDMTLLMEYIVTYEPELLQATQETVMTISSLDKHSHEAKNTNILAATIPGLIASKTGFTYTAGGNLALVFDPELGRPIVITILGSTEQGRFNDANKLINAALRYIGANE